MGVNTRIELPADCCVGDIAAALGILAGLPKQRAPLTGNPEGYWACRVSGVSVESASPPCCWIRLSGTMVDGQTDRSVLYHFEWSEGRPGARGMLPGSTPFWCAAAHRLVEVFGGSVVYNDHEWDGEAPDFKAPHPPGRLDAGDGEEWQARQQRLWNIAPLTRKELVAFREVAAYL